MKSSPLAPSSHLDTFARDHLPPQDQWPVFVFDRPEVHYPEQLNCAESLVDLHVREGRGQRTALHGVRNFESASDDFSWT